MYNQLIQTIKRAIRKKIGMPVEDYLALPIDEQRRYIERRKGRPMRTAQGIDRLLTEDEINRILDEALR